MTGSREVFSPPSAGVTVLNIDLQGRLRRLELKPVDEHGGWRVVLDGMPIEAEARELQPGILSLILEGFSFRCILDEAPAETAVQIGGRRFVATVEDPRSLTAGRRKAGAADGVHNVKAPMPGRIVRLLVAPGDQVEAHQGVIVIEAMKMQNELKAPRPGKVIEVRAQAGDTVAAGQILILMESAASPGSS